MSKTKIILDTSFISSLLNHEDTNNSLARKIYSSDLQDKTIIIPFIVSIELLATNQHENLSKVIDYLERFDSNINYPTKKTAMEFIEFIASNKTSLKSNDLYILFTAFNEDAQLITFDKKLNQVYKKLNAKNISGNSSIQDRK